MDNFRNKGVLITGAGRGIGKRLALGFAAAGAHVGLLARSKAELDLAKLEIEHAGGTAMKLQADVRDFEQIHTAVDRMHHHAGGVHVLICAAGIQGPIGPLVEDKPKAWAETIETNLIGVMHCCLAVLPEMIKRRAGKIIVLSGGGAGNPRPNFSAYAASKAAAVRFIETIAQEVHDQNVQVNALSPGGAYTHMTDEIIHAAKRAGAKEVDEAMHVRVTGGVSADEQIELAKFLASSRSNHITGKFVHIKDDWRKLEKMNMNPEVFTLRRVLKHGS